MSPVDYADRLRLALTRSRDLEWQVQAVGSLVEARHDSGALIRIAAGALESRDLEWHRRLLGAAGAILKVTPTSGLLLLGTQSAGRMRCIVRLLRPGSGAVVGEWQVLQKGAA